MKLKSKINALLLALSHPYTQKCKYAKCESNSFLKNRTMSKIITFDLTSKLLGICYICIIPRIKLILQMKQKKIQIH